MITTRDRVIGFFLRAPEEELTRQDIRVRWAVGDTGARDALNRMRADGLLNVERRANGQFVYTPTPLLLSLGNASR